MNENDDSEDRLIEEALAIVEKRIREGTATSSEIVRFLKIGDVK